MEELRKDDSTINSQNAAPAGAGSVPGVSSAASEGSESLLPPLESPLSSAAPNAAPEAHPAAALSASGANGGQTGAGESGQSAVTAAELGAVSFRAGEDRASVGSEAVGLIDILVAPDAMSAVASFAPSSDSDKVLIIDSVLSLMDKLNIRSGIDDKAISEALFQCNLARRIQRGVVIARGQTPVPGIVQHYTIEKNYLPAKREVSLDIARIDPRDQSNLIVAKKGEKLASFIPEVQGKAGWDIRGKELAPGKRSALEIQPGDNIEVRADGLYAGVDGLVSYSGDFSEGHVGIRMDNVLIVKGDVDYHTGHIVFPGDVIIEGRICDGFKVWAGGSIECKDTVDAFDINAKKNFICSQGIIGRGKAEIRVGGELRAKFIQNCKLAVRGNITLTTALVNSRLYSLGTADAGESGVIMGGEVFAAHGVRCGRLGNESRQRTLVHVGTDFSIQQRLEKYNERMRLLSLESRRILQSIKAAPTQELYAQKRKTEEAIVALSGMIGQLLFALDCDENATVEVKGDILPGTIIEICRLSLVIDRPLHGCRFFIDKTIGRISSERLSSKQAAAQRSAPKKA